jgi:glyoxylase-like metal-dependent hydrolase (beta-lactamase superfamily II)
MVLLHVLEHGYLEAVNAPFIDERGRRHLVTTTWPDRCYLVAHPAGLLLWDTGLPEADLLTDPWARGGYKKVITAPLLPWLAGLGVVPRDVTHLGLSHLHVDHAGNVGPFTAATVLLGTREHAYAFGPDIDDHAYHRADYASLEERETVLIGESHDVFGDGTAVIHAAPGHTPGHQVLALALTEPGPLVLVGDAFYAPEDRTRRRVPTWNTDLDASFRSIDRIEQLATASGARLLVHHDPESWP